MGIITHFHEKLSGGPERLNNLPNSATKLRQNKVTIPGPFVKSWALTIWSENHHLRKNILLTTICLCHSTVNSLPHTLKRFCDCRLLLSYPSIKITDRSKHYRTVQRDERQSPSSTKKKKKKLVHKIYLRNPFICFRIKPVKEVRSITQAHQRKGRANRRAEAEGEGRRARNLGEWGWQARATDRRIMRALKSSQFFPPSCWKTSISIC